MFVKDETVSVTSLNLLGTGKTLLWKGNLDLNTIFIFTFTRFFHFRFIYSHVHFTSYRIIHIYVLQMLMLGLQGDRSYAPVTSMCFNQQGDFLFAGYGDGHMSVWDVQRASAMKVITEHKAPVVHMLYMGQDSQVSKQLNVISGDIRGVVKLIRFFLFPLVNKISYYKTAVCNFQAQPFHAFHS